MKLAIVVMFVVSFFSAHCQQRPQVDSTVYIFLDVNLLNQNQKSTTYSKMFEKATDAEAFKEYEVKSNDNFYDLMSKNYNFFDRSLALDVAKYNDISNPDVILPGQKLKIPDLPAVPLDDADKRKVQYVDYLVNGEIKTIKAKDVGVDSTPSDATGKTNAGLWTLKFKNKAEALKFIKESGGLKSRNANAYFIVAEEPVFFNYSVPTESSSNVTNNRSKKDSIDLSFIEEANFRPFYILDEIDGDNCTHGRHVRDIIESILDDYGLAKGKAFISFFPINFFKNKDVVIDIIKKYYEGIPDQHKRQGAEKLIDGLKKTTKECNSCLPEEYLSVLFKYCYSLKRPDVISSSFFVSGYDSDLAPRIVEGRPTVLVTAGTNEPGKIVEDYFVADPDGLQVAKIEPIYSYTHLGKQGTFVVGSKDHNGELFGMRSRDGTNVPLMGHADGWKGKCIDVAMIGNSYSTPEIATKLFIARAFWRQMKMNVSSYEAKIRAVLSSDLEEKFVGQIASAGLLNMNKLLLPDGAFVSRNGSLTAVKVSTVNSVINDGEGEDIHIGRDTPNHARISGISILNNNLYVFQEANLVWKKLDPTKFHLEFTFRNVPYVFDSVASAGAFFDQLIIFK